MIGTLVRTDPALRDSLRWLALIALAGTAWLGLQTYTIVRSGGGDAWIGLTLMWLGPGLFLVFGPLYRRGAAVALAWPIPAYRIVAAHLLAVAAVTLLLVTVTWGCVVAGVALLTRIAARNEISSFALRTELPTLLVQMTAWSAAVMIVLQSRRPRLVETPRDLGHALTGVIAVVAAWVGLAWLAPLHPATVLVPVVIALAAGLRWWRRLPGALLVAPRALTAPMELTDRAETDPVAAAGGAAAPATAGSAWLSGGEAAGWRHRFLVARTLWQATGKHRWLFVFALLVLVGFGGILSDFYPEVLGGTDMSLLYVILISYTFFAFTGPVIARMSVGDAWPLPRSVALNVVVAPQLIALLLGYGIGHLIAAGAAEEHEPLVFATEGENTGLRLPLRFFALDWSGAPPVITAPWGESARPPAVWTGPGGSPVLYKPYYTPPEATPDFVAWQIERASGRVLSNSVPADEISERYLTHELDRRVDLCCEELSLLADHPDLRVRTREGPYLPILMTILLLFYYLGMLIYLRTFRPLISQKRRLTVFYLTLGLLLLLHIVPLALAIAQVVDMDLLTGVAQVMIRDLGEAGSGAVILTWAVPLLVGWGGYRLVIAALNRAELPVYSKDCK